MSSEVGATPAGPRAPSVARSLWSSSWARGGLLVGGAVLAAAVVSAIHPIGSAALGGNPAVVLLASPVFLALLGVGLVAWALAARPDLPWAERAILATPGILVLGGLPGVLPSAEARAGYLAVAGVLVVWFTYLLQYVYRHKQLEPRTMAFLREATFASVVATLGWFLWALDGSPFVWAATGPVAAVVLVRALRPTTVAERVPWLMRPGWAVQLLLFTFLAEFFVGALLDLEVAGRGFLQYIPFQPVTGAVAARVGLAIYDGLWFGAAVLASAWFLVALGVTMGGLVVLRMREVHHSAQRYRMGLMLGVYALAAVYVPSLASSTPLVSNRLLASLPIIGWGFGLRAGGPFEAGIFLAVLVMYACVGVLTVLFGRKALCSVMCGAAIVYQGSVMHEMRSFNQSSRVGRYFLGSRLSTAYVVLSSLALVSLFAVSLLAYLHRLPTVQVANGEYDSSALPLPIELYFGGLWFAMFVSTPYIGTYNCATTGLCHWGALSLPFAKVSLFRLRVKDRAVCQRCTTFDCAKACPVGLVDMPLAFRAKGEYRSTKCCGVGDCVGACPYGNLYHQDVRTRIVATFSRSPQPRYGERLPMVGAAAPTTGGGPPSSSAGPIGPT